MSMFGEPTKTTFYIKALYSRTGIDEHGREYLEFYEDPTTAKELERLSELAKLKRRSESTKRGWETRRANKLKL
jgi:hypothetical protein